MQEKMAERGCVWSDAETKLLLEIWSQENIQKQLQGSFRNVNIYSKLVEELRRNGYHSTVAQCRIKKRSRKDIRHHGQSAEEWRWQQIGGGRPS